MTDNNKQAVPREFEKDEVTGVIKDPLELAEARSKRPTAERVGRLEAKHDSLAGDISELKETVAKIDGKLEVVPQLVDLLKTVVSSEVAGNNAKLTATLKIGQDAAADQIEAAKARRALWSAGATKILAGAGIAGTAILAAIQAKGC